MSAAPLRRHVFPDTARLERELRERIAERAARAIEARGAFSIVLSGGTTPRRLYASLVSLPSPGWPRWHVYFSDERCLARGDAERNDTMARDAWLDHVPIPAAQIHSIPAELGAEAGAAAYSESLRGTGPFDLVLLGLGEDGHTASLFPGQAIGAEREAPAALAVHGAPKPPHERVSLGAARLAKARAVFVIVTGAAKQRALARLERSDDEILHRIAASTGLDVYADADAAGD